MSRENWTSNVPVCNQRYDMRMGKKLLLLVLAVLWLAGCATVPEPFKNFRIIYFSNGAESGFLSEGTMREQFGARVLAHWAQVQEAIQNEQIDALLIGPGMIANIPDKDALLLQHKRGLTLIFFNTYADEVEDLLDVHNFHMGWYAEPTDAESMSGDFVIGVSRMTQCSNGKPAYPTLFQPCEPSEDYGGGISTSLRSSFAGELNTEWDIEKFLLVFAGELQQAREAAQATLEP